LKKIILHDLLLHMEELKRLAISYAIQIN
jgi:hypothetical protein